jgi:hypothetical protein
MLPTPRHRQVGPSWLRWHCARRAADFGAVEFYLTSFDRSRTRRRFAVVEGVAAGARGEEEFIARIAERLG